MTVPGAPSWRGLRPDLVDRLVRPLPGDELLSWMWASLVTLFAAFLRFNRLGVPSKPVFDELYYAHDSDSLLNHGVELGPHFSSHEPAAFVVHPPLGKWMIAAGEWFHDDALGLGRAQPLVFKHTVFHYSSAGWRFSAALVGSLAVLILVRVVRRMTHSTMLGCVAGLLLAVDGLEFVQSRISMLDIFLMFWVLAAFACLVADRDDGRRRLADRLQVSGTPYADEPRLGIRPWRLGMAACLGAAVATKWDGVFFVVLFFLLALAWDVGARRTGGSQTPLRTVLRCDFAPLAVAFLLIPVIYTASWGGWFATGTGYDRFWATDPAHRSHWNLKLPLTGLTLIHVPDAWSNAMPEVVRSWIHYQWDIWRFHDTLASTHPYQSHPLGWLFLARPVSYFFSSPHTGSLGCTATSGCSKEILGIGTPAIWWGSVAALFAMLWFWISRRDWRAGAALLAILFTILPWVPSDTLDHRTMFLFYALPAVPFMVMALTLWIGYAIGPSDATLVRRQVGVTASGIFVILAVVNFFWLYPVLAAKVLPTGSWAARVTHWFISWV